jgi:hypothetical protein
MPLFWRQSVERTPSICLPAVRLPEQHYHLTAGVFLFTSRAMRSASSPHRAFPSSQHNANTITHWSLVYYEMQNGGFYHASRHIFTCRNAFYDMLKCVFLYAKRQIRNEKLLQSVSMGFIEFFLPSYNSRIACPLFFDSPSAISEYHKATPDTSRYWHRFFAILESEQRLYPNPYYRAPLRI